MRFLITLKNENEDIKLIFDNLKNTLTTLMGESILGEKRVHGVNYKKVALQLGFSCNMACSYCLQSKNTKKKFNKEDLDTLLSSITEDDINRGRIEFWGGEPLLYLEEIKYIVRNLKIKPKGGFSIITNGLNLDLSIAKWLMENNFTVSISHDALSQDIRGKDPLKDQKTIKAIQYIIDNYKDRFSFNSVISNASITTKERRDYFSSKINRSKNLINFNGEGPVTNTDINFIKDSDSQLLYEDLYDEGLYYGYNQSILNNFTSSINRNSVNVDSISCNVMSDNYSVKSLEGRELTCHNFDKPFTINPIKSEIKCLECPIINICKGTCTAIPKGSAEHKATCNTSFNYHVPIFWLGIESLLDYKYMFHSIEKL